MSRTLSDLADALADLDRRVTEAHQYLRIDEARTLADGLEAEASEPSLWDDPDRARAVTTRLSRVRDDIERWERARADVEDAAALAELATEEDDADLLPEIDAVVEGAERRLADIEADGTVQRRAR